jgi:hypothetical protein
MPAARLLLIQQEPDGIFLFGFVEDGDFSGDAWHQSIEEAMLQATFQYGEAQGTWRPIPSELTDFADDDLVLGLLNYLRG